MSENRQKTILLVEDEPIIAMLEANQLEKAGYRVIQAETGERAIAIVSQKKERIDLILMDIDLGEGISGTDAAAEILKNNDIPLIFLSAHAEKEIVEKTEKITSYGYVIKNSGITVLDASIKLAFRFFNEITSRRRAEEELDSRNLLLTTLLDNLSIGVFMVEAPSGKPIVANEMAKQLLGRGILPEVSKDNLAEVYRAFKGDTDKTYPADEMPIVLGMFGRKSYIDDMMVERPDGSRRLLEVFGCPVFDRGGAVKASLVSFRDITERWRAQEALRISEVKYRTLFEVLPVGLTVSDSAGAILESNKIAESILGLSSEEQARRKIDGQEWRIVKKDGSPMSADDYASTRALKENRLVENVEMGLVKGPDEVSWINVTATPVPLEGYGVAIAYSDITARVRIEEQLRATTDYLENLINYANAPIIVWDADYKITKFNHAFEKLTGRTFDEVAGQNLDLLFPQNAKSESMDHIYQTAKGERWETVEIKIQHKDGTVKTVLWNSANIYDSRNKKIISTIAQGNDITSRKQAEENIQNLLVEKELILKEVHHRIKNNMNTISGLLILQAEVQQNPLTKNILHDAAARVSSMSVLYDKLYRVENRDSISTQKYFPALIDEIIRIFPQKASVKIETKIDDIVLNAKLLSPLGLIINEFITNSMKYGFKGRDGGTIEVSFSRTGDRVSLTLQDDGPGIPEAVLAKDAPGFGLQLVNMLVRQIRGSMSVERLNGTKFIIEFDV